MIKVSEIQQKYSDYLIDEKELEKILVKPKPKTVWDLECGDTYFCLYPTGVIEDCVWKDSGFGKCARENS